MAPSSGERGVGGIGSSDREQGGRDYGRTWGEDDGERRKTKDDGRRKEEIVDGGEFYT